MNTNTFSDIQAWCGRHRDGIATTLLLGLVFLVFAPSLGYPFLDSWDDVELTAQWRHLRLTAENLLYWWRTPLVNIHMPLTMYSYMFDFWWWERDPFGYRLQSLVWHMAAAWLAFRCLQAMGLRRGWAWLAAAAFAVHPQRLESVVWIAERKDVMCGVFYLWALYFHLKASPDGKPNLRVWLLTVAALLCKPMAVSLPAVLVLIDYARKPERPVRDYVRRLWPFFAVAVLSMAIAFWTHRERPLGAPTWSSGPLVLYNYCWYVVNALLPLELNPFYSQVRPERTAVVRPVIFYLSLALLLTAMWKREGRDFMLQRALPVLLALVVVLLPVAGLFHPINIDHADRYSYLASLPMFYMVFWVLQEKVRRQWGRVTVLVLSAIWLVFLVVRTEGYLPAWRSYCDLLSWSLGERHPHQMVLVEQALADLNRGEVARAAVLSARLERKETGEDWRDPRSGPFYAQFIQAEAAYKQRRYIEAEKRLRQIYPGRAPREFYSPSLEMMIRQQLIGINLNLGRYREAVEAIDGLLAWYQTRRRDFFYYYYAGLRAGLYHDWPTARECFRLALTMNAATRTTATEIQQLMNRCAAIQLKP